MVELHQEQRLFPNLRLQRGGRQEAQVDLGAWEGRVSSLSWLSLLFWNSGPR